MKDLDKKINSFDEEKSKELSNKKTWEDPTLSNLSAKMTKGTTTAPDGDGGMPYS